MFYIYICLTILIMLLANRCLKNKFEGIIPVVLMSTIVSAIVVLVVQQVLFNFYHEYDVETKRVHKNYISITDDHKNFYFTDEDNDRRMQSISKIATADSVVVTKEKKSYRLETDYYIDNTKSSYATVISNNCAKNVEVVYHLTKKDYEVYKSYKNNAE